MKLNGPESVSHLMGPQEFMQVASAQLVRILMHILEHIHEDLEVGTVRLIVRGPAAAVLVGRLHQPHGKARGLDVIRVDVSCRGVLIVVKEESHRLPQVVYDLLGRLLGRGRIVGIVAHILAHRLDSNAALCVGA